MLQRKLQTIAKPFVILSHCLLRRYLLIVCACAVCTCVSCGCNFSLRCNSLWHAGMCQFICNQCFFSDIVCMLVHHVQLCCGLKEEKRNEKAYNNNKQMSLICLVFFSSDSLEAHAEERKRTAKKEETERVKERFKLLENVSKLTSYFKSTSTTRATNDNDSERTNLCNFFSFSCYVVFSLAEILFD